MYMPHQADVEGSDCLPTFAPTIGEGVRWLFNPHSQGLGGLIADDMGLGKPFKCRTCSTEFIHQTSPVSSPSSLCQLLPLRR